MPSVIFNNYTCESLIACFDRVFHIAVANADIGSLKSHL